MLKQGNVKHNLYKVVILLIIGYVLSSCNGGGGDNYSSYTYWYAIDGGYVIDKLVLSNDRRKVKYQHLEPGKKLAFETNWVDIKQGGQGRFQNNVFFEISNQKFRIKRGGNWGQWANICNTGINYSAFSYTINNYAVIEGKVEVNDDKVRVCGRWYEKGKSPPSWVCGNWVKFDRDYVCGPSVQCPSGYTYNSSRKICEAEPVCNKGSYDATLKKCYIGDFTCPLGNYECLKLADGKRYCSPYSCIDATNSSNYIDEDTPEGINDKKNDGQIDENGNCLGTIYIFNGQDKRCRTAGVETGFSDCCKKTKTWFGLGQCKSNEQYLAKLRSWGKRDGRCHYVGKYCTVKIKGVGCLQHKKTFCCFSSPLARIIQEQGRKQLGISWGEPKHPNCRGFTMEEFQKIDWNKIDFSEWINEEVIPNVEKNLNNKLQNTIDNIKSTIKNKY